MKHWDKYDLGGVFDVFDFDKKMALINLDMIYEYAVKLDIIVSEESQLEDWVKMKLTRIEQNVSDVAHSLEGWEKFDEGGMIFKKQLLSISKYAHKLIEMIKGGSKLMSWQENKLAVSANDIDNLYHHLDYKVGNRASQKKFATGGMMKYPDLSNETPIVINEPDNQKISEIDIALIDIALVRQDLGIEKTKIGSSNDAYQIFKQLWNKDSINVREEMNVLFLNNANEPIGYYEHTKGAINSTLVDVEMIAALALKTLSKGVILAHNHPSGNNKPSEADIKLYQQVKTALKMFNVTVLDSMILVPNSDNYYSLADNGYEMGGSLSFERGGSVYRIVEGYDHYKGMPLYQVIGDNDYVGEYHTDRKDAEKELQELIGGVGENIKSYRYGFDTYIQVDGTNYGGKLVLGRGKVKGKENIYLSHIDWDENNVPENSEEIEEYVDKNLNNLLQNAQQYNNGGGVGEIKFEELIGKKFSIEKGSGHTTKTWSKEDLLEEIKRVIKHNLFDKDFYYNWTNEGTEYSNIFDKYTLNPMIDDIDNTLNKYFVFKNTAYSPSPFQKILIFEIENDRLYIDNWFKTNTHISSTLRNDYKKYREKYAGVTPYAKGGKINSGREAMFKSQEPHEQRYKRKREWKEYKKEGWFGDWYEMGGNVSNLQKKIDYINKNYDGVTASKTYSDNRIQVVSPYFNTLNEIKRKEFGGSGLMERYGNTSSYVLYSNQNYEMGGNVSSELSEPQKEFSKSAEMLVRENLQNGEICMCKLRKILGHEPNYPKQVVGSLVLEKAYLRNFYKI
jgi:DNA repair protein RadC